MRILLVRNTKNQKAVEALFLVISFLQSEHIDYDVIDSDALYGIVEVSQVHKRRAELQVDADYELAVVLGGDGTILRTARLLSGLSTPILGINFGHLGFLANDSKIGVIELLTRAFCGELLPSYRSNLDISVTLGADDQEADHDGPFHFTALNELTVSRGEVGRTLRFAFDISNTHIADLQGDGLIVATATGSTAYSLAAGGPLVTPNFTGLIVQPLAPHTLTARAILADANDVVCVTFPREEDKQAATLFIDGDLIEMGAALESVAIRRAQEQTVFLYAEQEHFYTYSAQKFFLQ